MDLGLIDRLPDLARDLLVDEEEVHTAHAWESSAHLHLDLFLVRALLLLACDLYVTTRVGRSFLVVKRAVKSLISLSDDLVDGELQEADVIVAIQVLYVSSVIHIVDIDPVLLALFKVVLHVKGLYPAGVKIVHDNFCQADALPLVADLLREYYHAVRSSERVHIR